MRRVYVRELRVYDALTDELVAEGFDRLEQIARYCYDNRLELPLHSKFGTFLRDAEGRFLYRGTHPGDFETAGGEIVEGLGICPVCAGLAQPRSEGECMICTLCGFEFQCVPPQEEIGEVD